MNEVLSAIASRSSTRGYEQRKLTQEEMNILVKAALQAPTATNRQEIHVTVLDGDNPILTEIEDAKNSVREGLKPAHNFYYEAPAVFLLSGEEAFYWSKIDAGIAAQNIALAAESLGLGSLIIGCIRDALTGDKKEYFGKLLEFPEGYEYEIAVAVGHKAVSKEPHEIDVDKNVTYL